MRFLISRLSSLGDVVCTLPAAVALKRRYAGSEVVWAVAPAFADVVRACEAVDTVLPVAPRLHPSTWPRVEGQFDAAFDLQGLFKSAIIVGRSRARRKLGYHWQREGSAFFSSAVAPDPSSLHVVDQYVDVVRAYGAEMNEAEFGLKPTADAWGAMAAALKERSVTGRYVLFNAGAGWVTKRWPPPAFAEVIGALQGHDVTPILIGGADAPAKEAADAVLGACAELGTPAPVSMLGQTTVAQLIALVAGAAVHVGGDTGSSHIAAALGVPAVGLYSITRPERCCPYGQIERVHYDPRGLDRIRPADVLRSVLEAVG